MRDTPIGFLFGLAPGGVYRAMDCYQPCGALLPHPFTLTGLLLFQQASKKNTDLGGLLSAALSVGFRPPGVTWRPTLWSPDFPPSTLIKQPE